MGCSRLEEYSIANIAVGLTLSGIDPNEIPAWDYDRSGLVGFYEYWTEEVWQVLCDTAEDAQVAKLLRVRLLEI